MPDQAAAPAPEMPYYGDAGILADPETAEAVRQHVLGQLDPRQVQMMVNALMSGEVAGRARQGQGIPDTTPLQLRMPTSTPLQLR